MIAYVLADSGARLVFHDAARAPALPEGVAGIAFDGDDWKAFLAPGSQPAWQPEADDVALMLYTSGSTGKPKGCGCPMPASAGPCARARRPRRSIASAP
ncbi:AMP-binding protein [Achromobacter xylosoxidans]